MYIVQIKANMSPKLRASLSREDASVSTRVATLKQAYGFISELCGLKYGWIDTDWLKRDGRYVIDVYDWCDCWFLAPPVLATIIAPPELIVDGVTATA